MSSRHGHYHAMLFMGPLCLWGRWGQGLADHHWICITPSTQAFSAASSADVFFWELIWDTNPHTFCAYLHKFIWVHFPWPHNLPILFPPNPNKPVKWLVITRNLRIFLLTVTPRSRLSWWLLIITPINMNCILLHIWCLLTGSITPLYWLYWKRCPLWGYSSEAVSEACISLFISGKEQNMPLLCKEYFELQAIEEKQRQEKLSALSLFA